ncbi:MAG: ABC transporter ATP-binding protein [Ferruginibacter sp.]|nr:ABC transporter ATP-binding protein [Ferruginibacter sp.]
MKKTLHSIRTILTRAEKKQFFSLMLLDIVVSIFDILFLALLLLIVRFYIQPDTTGSFSFLPAWLVNRNAAWLIAAFLLLFGIKNVFAFFVTRSNFRFINRVAIRISLNNISSYQQVAFSEFVHTDSSVFIRNICYRPFEFSQYILSGFQQIVTQFTLMFITLVAIILFNAKIFLLLVLLLLPPVVMVFWFIKKRLAAQKKSIHENNELSFRYVLDALKGYVESNTYGRNHFFSSRFINARRRFSNALFGSLALQSLPGRIIEIFAVLGLFILIVIANQSGKTNGDMLITMGAFMAAAYKIIPGIVKIINVSGQMKTYESSVHSMEENKNSVPEETAVKQRLSLNSVQLKNIAFTYNEKRVLSNFSITINKGDFIGITGESGKGKTTLMNLLLGFLQPASGEIFFNNQPLTGEMIKQYWPSVAYVRQQGFLIHDTLLKNITLEEELTSPQQLQVALNVSGLAEMIKAYPEGIEKTVTENGKNISGGQQQRINIARALYKNADLILLDEPFNELDAAATATLLLHFKELAAAGKSVVMITHDKESLQYCNKIVSLDEA